jgi:hypothetical protein
LERKGLLYANKFVSELIAERQPKEYEKDT